MAKTKLIFKCQTCDHESPRWLGQCPSCQNWNTFEEELRAARSKMLNRFSAASASSVVTFSQLENLTTAPLERRPTVFKSLDAALGGGLLDGSLLLLGGAPGVGKSTLVSHMAGSLSASGEKVLIASGGEESSQIAERLKRLGVKASENLLLASRLFLEELVEKARTLQPKLIIVD